MNQSVKYELQEIDNTIAQGEGKSDFKKSDLIKLTEQVKTEIDKIKKTLVHEVFSFDDERHLERYIQYNQMALIGLLDKLDHLQQTKLPDTINFFKIIYTQLDTLLHFVERHFAKYFDQDSKAPDGYLALAKKEAQTAIEKIRPALLQNNADEKILLLMLQVLQNIVATKPERGITFRKAIYAKEMQKELFRLIEKNQAGNISEELRQIMYYLNYNSIKVVTYHAHYISSLLESAETRTEKIEKLSLVMKTISQAQIKPGIRYNPNAPGLKDQLTEYISVEMEYQERLQRLNAASSQRPDNPLSGFKLKFEASVAQLAYLFKIFIETKLIVSNNLTQTLQFLVLHAVTKKAENVSFASIRAKYYNVESSTKESVRGILASMIQYIDHAQ